MKQREFTCPKCGSHWFNSSDWDNPEEMKRHCKGGETNLRLAGIKLPNNGKYCGFTFYAKDDHLYFK